MTPDEVKASYRRALAPFEGIVIRRYTGAGAGRHYVESKPCQGRVLGYQPHELVDGVVQGDQKIILFADDLVSDGNISLPLKKGDKAVVLRRELNIEGIDANTRRVGGVVIAYELQVRG